MGHPVIDLTKLSSDERLRLIEEIWESLAPSPKAIPLTAAQREELDRRLDELAGAEEDEGIPWDEVARQLRARGK